MLFPFPPVCLLRRPGLEWQLFCGFAQVFVLGEAEVAGVAGDGEAWQKGENGEVANSEEAAGLVCVSFSSTIFVVLKRF